MTFSCFGQVWLPKKIENGAFNGQDVSDLATEVFVTPPIPKPHFHMCRPSKIGPENSQKVYCKQTPNKINFLGKAHLQRDEGRLPGPQKMCILVWALPPGKRPKQTWAHFRAQGLPTELQVRFSTNFGSILESFWSDFGFYFGGGLNKKTLFYLHGSSFFKSCYVLLGFCAFRGHSRNSSFTCMGVLCSRFR